MHSVAKIGFPNENIKDEMRVHFMPRTNVVLMILRTNETLVENTRMHSGLNIQRRGVHVSKIIGKGSNKLSKFQGRMSYSWDFLDFYLQV